MSKCHYIGDMGFVLYNVFPIEIYFYTVQIYITRIFDCNRVITMCELRNYVVHNTLIVELIFKCAKHSSEISCYKQGHLLRKRVFTYRCMLALVIYYWSIIRCWMES